MWRCGEQGVKTCEAASEQVFRAKILAWSKIERPCEPLDAAHSTTSENWDSPHLSQAPVRGQSLFSLLKLIVLPHRLLDIPNTA